MSERWRSADGWAVEIVELTGTAGRRWDGTWIRVTHWGFHVADVPRPADVERWVPLAELEPGGFKHRRRAAALRAAAGTRSTGIPLLHS